MRNKIRYPVKWRKYQAGLQKSSKRKYYLKKLPFLLAIAGGLLTVLVIFLLAAISSLAVYPLRINASDIAKLDQLLEQLAKIQAAIAMSQRAKVASERAKDPEKKKDLGVAHKVYQSYIDTNKKDK